MSKRNSYSAILDAPEFVGRLLIDAEKSGAWTSGIESDKKLRGSAINTAIYGYDETRGLAVIQVRECIFNPRKFNKVRKDYYLLGRTENAKIFCHPIESPCRSRLAMDDAAYCVRYVLCKIWDVIDDYLDDIIRQGDIAFVPILKLPMGAEKIVDKQVTLRDTHVVSADKIYKFSDEYYVMRGARMRHTKREHKPIKALSGFYRVQLGVRADNWGFTAPCGD